jgi:predicted nuclease with TOPRIM domain
MIDVFTKQIEELESNKVLINENNKRIQSKINELEDQISELSKNLQS